MSTFGQKLQNRRQVLDLSLSDLSIASGLSRGYIHNIEHGHRNPSDRALVKLSPALQLSLPQLRAWLDEDRLGPVRAAAIAIETTSLQDVLLSPVWAESLHKPTKDEVAIMRMAEEEGIIYGGVRLPGFWDMLPEERRASFLYLEGLVMEHRKLRKATRQA